MGNTERSIRTCRRKNTSRLQPKKAIPAAIKTLGDYLLVKRYEKGLQQRYVAQMAGVATLTVKEWEMDVTNASFGVAVNNACNNNSDINLRAVPFAMGYSPHLLLALRS